MLPYCFFHWRTSLFEMDFIIDKAEISDDFYSGNSDCSDEESLLDDFIESENDDGDEEDLTFYRRFENRERFKSFQNQSKNLVDEFIRSERDYYGNDNQPEMFVSENREQIEFHSFKDYKQTAEEFKKTLLCFSDTSIKNNFFYSVVYGLAHIKTEKRPITFESAIDILGRENFLKLKEIQQEIMLDYTQFGFLDRCMKVNDVLAANFGCFLRFYERRNKFRYQLRQKLKSKNEMRAELSSCVFQKFNGYDLLRTELSRDEKKNLLLLDIVYEPTLDRNKPILCYFSPKICLAFRTCYDRNVRGSKQKINSSAAKQCPYCNNFFIKSESKIEEHISTCSGQAGSNFTFDNGKIINYQDNFKKIGDLPFSVYYDFETTTSSVDFFYVKTYVISYCIIVAFHPDLNLPHWFIYRAYDQTKDEIESLIHFDVVQADFFNFKKNHNLKTSKQLQNVILAVKNRSRETALAEMFNIELKFTIDCLRFWFNRNKKILELDENEKHELAQKKKPITCCLCDFPMESRAVSGLFEHVCKAEYLFLENVFKSRDLHRMSISDFDTFFRKVQKVLDNVDEFRESIEKENLENINSGKDNSEIEEIVKKIKKIKTTKNDKRDDCSKKNTAVKSNLSIKCTARFMSGKFLMFAKLSLKSFIHSLTELLSFPEENDFVQKIYRKYKIEKVYVYHIFTDTDSTSLQFIVVSSINSYFSEDQVRDILFEIFSKTEIRPRFNKSDKFWQKFGVHDPKNQKVLGLYEVESINDPCLVTLAANPKEYFEYFQSEITNKKHEEMKKGSAGMDYLNFAERIKPLYDFNKYRKPKRDTKPVVQISVKKGEMTTHQIIKSKFSQLNGKRFYFPNAIISLPFEHSALKDLDEFKKNKWQRIENYFLQDREHLLELEKKSLKEMA